MQGVKAPCAFNQYVFLNFFKSLKIRTAWRKDFFDTLKPRCLPRFREGSVVFLGIYLVIWKERVMGAAIWLPPMMHTVTT